MLSAVPDVATERAFLGTALHAPVRGQLEVPCGALIFPLYHCTRINIREVWVANRRVHALETSRIRH